MKNPDSGTELCIATLDAEPEKVQQLLAQGADVNAVGDRRYTVVAHSTPLWLAVRGACRMRSKHWNELSNAITEAIPERTYDNAGKRKRLTAIVETLLRAKANTEALSYGTTPLAQATHAADLEVVRLLLSAGANSNAASLSVLSNAAKKERVKGPLGQMGYFNTILHTAVEKNSLPIVEALLVAGADPTRGDHEGKTPLDIAVEKGFDEIAVVLRQAQSDSASK